MEERYIDAFEAARVARKLPSSFSIEIHDYALSQLPSSVAPLHLEMITMPSQALLKQNSMSNGVGLHLQALAL